MKFTTGAHGEHILETEMLIARPRAEVFAFFADAGNLETVTPPEPRFRILTPTDTPLESGAAVSNG